MWCFPAFTEPLDLATAPMLAHRWNAVLSRVLYIVDSQVGNWFDMVLKASDSM